MGHLDSENTPSIVFVCASPPGIAEIYDSLPDAPRIRIPSPDTKRSGQHHRRRLLERRRPMAQLPPRRLELQAGGLPGPQEVTVIPGKQGAGPEPPAGGGMALHRHGAAHRGDTVGHC